ncbi:amidohydrolase [Roseomonas sp. OT10]|uniref:amidohydrolase family protein n=1 Tax=Roseomonas cutis TaxID=2897332 RepID=UPI001E5A5A4C|nr:amidohydrolase [Roseomonas sp. OT10]UFN48524.1 amidohydrolase [Roseomonas sp. OT10]
MLIAGAVVLTVDGDNTILEPGWVRLRDGAIAEVSAAPLAAEAGEEVVDASGRLLMPGLVNTHVHLFQTLLRGVYEERPLAVYLDYIYRSGVELTPEDSRLSAMLGSLESLRAGATTLLDHHFLNRIPELAEATIDGMLAVGIRAGLARTVMDMGEGIPDAVKETPEAGLRCVDALLRRHAEDCRCGRVTIMTGPNTAGVNASAEAVTATRDFARLRGIRRSSHVAEYKGAVEQVRRRYGQEGVVEWLHSLDAIGPDLLAVHAVQVQPGEVDHLAKGGASVSHNPFSNLFCGDRNAPVSDYLAAGIPVGFGTDGGANNNAQGILDTLRITRLLQRAHPTAPEAITPERAIRMATIEGARALGLDHLIGSIEPGKRGDLILLDYEVLPHTVPTHDVTIQLVHSMKGSDVRTVWVDGRMVMRDRVVLTVDEPAVLSAAAAAGHALVRRLG